MNGCEGFGGNFSDPISHRTLRDFSAPIQIVPRSFMTIRFSATP
jgi:hypothetical protein